MTLRTKFIVVLLLFCAAVGINLAAAAYYSGFQLSEANALFESTFRPGIYVEYTLESVRELNRVVAEADSEEQVDSTQIHRIGSLLSVIRSVAARLRGYEHVLGRITDAKALQRLLDLHQAHVQEYLNSRGSALAAASVALHWQEYSNVYTALEIRLAELQRELNRASVLPQEAATKVYYILFGMVLAEVAALMITFSFFRRWMLKPIRAIQRATEQIADGNLDYRLQGLANDELGALGREVNQMAAALAVAQKESKQKARMAAIGEMVSVVAHNIRNPLAGIRATAQSCLHAFEAGSEVSKQQERIITSVDSLEQWLKELLHLNRPLELKIEPTSVDDLVADLTQIFQPSTQRKRIEIEYQPARTGQSIGVDRQYFVQALASILDNAIEAAPPDSVVGIRIGRREQPQSGFFIEISDAGPGVPEAINRQVFEPYFSTKPGGTGIGLSMAKKIVEAHAGTLSVGNGSAAGRGQGAVFRIEIPDRGRGAISHG